MQATPARYRAPQARQSRLAECPTQARPARKPNTTLARLASEMHEVMRVALQPRSVSKMPAAMFIELATVEVRK